MKAYPHCSHPPRQTAGFIKHHHGPGMSQGMDPMRHAHGHYPQPMGYPGYPMDVSHYRQQQNSGLFGFANERFFKGLLIGAAAAYLLTNENVQRTAIKGAVKAWSLLQGGVEELKERFHDADAEIRAEAGE